MLEVGGIFEIAESRKSVPRLRSRRDAQAMRAPAAAASRHFIYWPPSSWLSPRPTTTDVGKPTLKSGILLRIAEAVPVRIPVYGAIEVAAPCSGSTAERGRARASRQRAPRGSLAKMIRSMILSITGFLMPISVAAAVAIGGGRAPVFALLVAGRKALREYAGDDVEVEIPHPVLDIAPNRPCGS